MTTDLTSNQRGTVAPVTPAGRAKADTPTGNWQRLLVVAVLLAIVLLGLDLRVRAVRDTVVHLPLRADAGQYYVYAYNLRQYGVYSHEWTDDSGSHPAPQPDAFRSPGYPLFLTAFMNGKDVVPFLGRVKAAQAVLSVLVVVLIYLIARRFLSIPLALLAALLTALSPHLINANVYVLTESLFAFCVTMLFWVYALYVESGRLWILLLVGILIGIGALVRPSLQYFVVPMIVLVTYYAGDGRRLKAAGLIVLGFVMVFSPWVIRNLHTLNITSDQRLAIATLHHGAYPDFKYQNDDRSFGYPYRADPNSATIAESMDSVLAEIRRRFSEEPGRHLRWYLIGKPVMLWSWDIVQGMGNAFIYPVMESPYFVAGFMDRSHWFMRDLHWPLVALAALAALAVWLPAWVHGLDPRARFAAQGISLLCIYFTALHMVGSPFPRYSVPLRPMLYAMASLGLALLCRSVVTVYQAHCSRRKRRTESRKKEMREGVEPRSQLK